MTNAFQQAAAQASQPTQPAQYAQPQSYTPPPEPSSLADAYPPTEPAQSQFFGGGKLLPSSLFNKTHGLGTERHGVITAAPYDTHSRDFNTKKPKYWPKSPLPNGDKISTSPVDHVTGEKLDPVLDTVIEMDTDYRFDATESAAVNRDPNTPDDGTRAFYVSGADIKQIKAEIRRLGITNDAGFIGLKISVTRVGQKPNPGGYPSWINKITLSR